MSVGNERFGSYLTPDIKSMPDADAAWFYTAEINKLKRVNEDLINTLASKLSEEKESAKPIHDSDKQLKRGRTKLALLTDEEKKERHKEQMRQWREKNTNCGKTYRQRYYEKNREDILAKKRAKRKEERELLAKAAALIAI